MTVKQLESIRSRIAHLKKQVTVTRCAGLPVSEVEAAVRAQLVGAANEFLRIRQGIADCIREGRHESLDGLMRHTYEKDEVPMIAFGGALAAYGVDRFVKEALEMAGKQSGERLTATEREARLDELRREIYALELEEETLVQALDADRRPDADARAVLQMPLEVAFAEGEE